MLELWGDVQVKVTMEYSRKMPAAEEGGADGRVMTFGTVMLLSPGKLSEGADPAPQRQQQPTAPQGAAGGAPGPLNVAELVVGRGFATVIRHRDFEERSAHYEALQAAEHRAIKGKRNLHSSKEPPVNNVNDLSVPVSAPPEPGWRTPSVLFWLSPLAPMMALTVKGLLSMQAPVSVLTAFLVEASYGTLRPLISSLFHYGLT